MLTKKRLLLRSIATSLLMTFVCGDLRLSADVSVADAAPMESTTALTPQQTILQNPHAFEAPVRYATLNEIHQGTNGRFIIHIQDAHSNFSGQENLAGALQELMGQYDVHLVLSEGGWGDCSLTPMKKIASTEVWKKIARRFLVTGDLQGEEYLNLISDRPMKILGIEDPALYEEGLGEYQKLAEKREALLDYLEKTERAVEKIKNRLYPREVLRYENQKQSGRLYEGSGFKALWNLAAAHAVDLSEYAALAGLAALQEKEKNVNFEAANLEQAALVEELIQKGGSQDLDEYFEKASQMKGMQLAQLAYFQNTLNRAKEKGVFVENFTNLVAYVDYLKDFSLLNFDGILSDAQKAEDRIYAEALRDETAQKIHAIDRFLQLLLSAHRIQMSSEEYRSLIANEPDFSTEATQAFLNRKLAELGYFEDLIPYQSMLGDGRQALGDFYDSVQKRDFAFVQNVETILRDEDQRVAVMITGGYHTEHLKKLLREKGYGYAVLTPIVTTATSQKKYEKLLLTEKHGTKKTVKSISGGSAKNERSLADLDGDLTSFLKKKIDQFRVQEAVAEMRAGGVEGSRLAEVAEAAVPGAKARLAELFSERDPSVQGARLTEDYRDIQKYLKNQRIAGREGMTRRAALTRLGALTGAVATGAYFLTDDPTSPAPKAGLSSRAMTAEERSQKFNSDLQKLRSLQENPAVLAGAGDLTETQMRIVSDAAASFDLEPQFLAAVLAEEMEYEAIKSIPKWFFERVFTFLDVTADDTVGLGQVSVTSTMMNREIFGALSARRALIQKHLSPTDGSSVESFFKEYKDLPLGYLSADLNKIGLVALTKLDAVNIFAAAAAIRKIADHNATIRDNLLPSLETLAKPSGAWSVDSRKEIPDAEQTKVPRAQRRLRLFQKELGADYPADFLQLLTAMDYTGVENSTTGIRRALRKVQIYRSLLESGKIAGARLSINDATSLRLFGVDLRELQRVGFSIGQVSNFVRQGFVRVGDQPKSYEQDFGDTQVPVIQNALREKVKARSGDRELVSYVLGIGSEPRELIRDVQMVARALVEQVGRDDAQKWKLTFVAADADETSLGKAIAAFDEEAAKSEYAGLNMELITAQMNFLSLGQMAALKENVSKKGDVVFHRNTSYLNLGVAAGWLDPDRIPTSRLQAEALNAYVQTRNVFSSLVDAGAVYVIEPVPALFKANVPEAGIPGARRLGEKRSGVYEVTDPGPMADINLIDFMNTVSGARLVEIGPGKRTETQGDRRQALLKPIERSVSALTEDRFILSVEGTAGSGKNYLGRLIQESGLGSIAASDISFIDLDTYLPKTSTSGGDTMIQDPSNGQWVIPLRANGLNSYINFRQFEKDLLVAKAKSKAVVIVGVHADVFAERVAAFRASVRIQVQTRPETARLRVLQRDGYIDRYTDSVALEKKREQKPYDVVIDNDLTVLNQNDLTPAAPAQAGFADSTVYGTVRKETGYQIKTLEEADVLGDFLISEARSTGLNTKIDPNSNDISEAEGMVAGTSTILRYLMSHGESAPVVTLRRYENGMEVVVQAQKPQIPNINDTSHMPLRPIFSHVPEVTFVNQEGGYSRNFASRWSDDWKPQSGSLYMLAQPAKVPDSQIGWVVKGAAVPADAAASQGARMASYGEMNALVETLAQLPPSEETVQRLHPIVVPLMVAAASGRVFDEKKTPLSRFHDEILLIEGLSQQQRTALETGFRGLVEIMKGDPSNFDRFFDRVWSEYKRIGQGARMAVTVKFGADTYLVFRADGNELTIENPNNGSVSIRKERFFEGQILQIGRLAETNTQALKRSVNPAAPLVLTLVTADDSVSRLHAQIKFEGGVWFIKDGSPEGKPSKNGTRRDDVQIGTDAWFPLFAPRLGLDTADITGAFGARFAQPVDAYDPFYESIRSSVVGKTEIKEDDLTNPRKFLTPEGTQKPSEQRLANGTFGITEVVFLDASETRSRMEAFQQELRARFGAKLYPVDADKLHLTTQGLELQWDDKAAGTKKTLALHQGMNLIDPESEPFAGVRARARGNATSAVRMQVARVNWNPEIGIFWELRPYLEAGKADPIMERRKTWDLPQPRPPHVTAAYFAQPFSEQDLTDLRTIVSRHQTPGYFGDIEITEAQVIAYEDFSFNEGYRVLESTRLSDGARLSEETDTAQQEPSRVLEAIEVYEFKSVTDGYAATFERSRFGASQGRSTVTAVFSVKEAVPVRVTLADLPQSEPLNMIALRTADKVHASLVTGGMDLQEAIRNLSPNRPDASALPVVDIVAENGARLAEEREPFDAIFWAANSMQETYAHALTSRDAGAHKIYGDTLKLRLRNDFYGEKASNWFIRDGVLAAQRVMQSRGGFAFRRGPKSDEISMVIPSNQDPVAAILEFNGDLTRRYKEEVAFINLGGMLDDVQRQRLLQAQGVLSVETLPEIASKEYESSKEVDYMLMEIQPGESARQAIVRVLGEIGKTPAQVAIMPILPPWAPSRAETQGSTIEDSLEAAQMHQGIMKDRGFLASATGDGIEVRREARTSRDFGAILSLDKKKAEVKEAELAARIGTYQSEMRRETAFAGSIEHEYAALDPGVLHEAIGHAISNVSGFPSFDVVRGPPDSFYLVWSNGKGQWQVSLAKETVVVKESNLKNSFHELRRASQREGEHETKFGFKQVNDHFGPRQGNVLIRLFNAALTSAFRSAYQENAVLGREELLKAASAAAFEISRETLNRGFEIEAHLTTAKASDFAEEGLNAREIVQKLDHLSRAGAKVAAQIHELSDARTNVTVSRDDRFPAADLKDYELNLPQWDSIHSESRRAQAYRRLRAINELVKTHKKFEAGSAQKSSGARLTESPEGFKKLVVSTASGESLESAIRRQWFVERKSSRVLNGLVERLTINGSDEKGLTVSLDFAQSAPGYASIPDLVTIAIGHYPQGRTIGYLAVEPALGGEPGVELMRSIAEWLKEVQDYQTLDLPLTGTTAESKQRAWAFFERTFQSLMVNNPAAITQQKNSGANKIIIDLSDVDFSRVGGARLTVEEFKSVTPELLASRVSGLRDRLRSEYQAYFYRARILPQEQEYLRRNLASDGLRYVSHGGTTVAFESEQHPGLIFKIEKDPSSLSYYPTVLDYEVLKRYSGSTATKMVDGWTLSVVPGLIPTAFFDGIVAQQKGTVDPQHVHDSGLEKTLRNDLVKTGAEYWDPQAANEALVDGRLAVIDLGALRVNPKTVKDVLARTEPLEVLPLSDEAAIRSLVELGYSATTSDFSRHMRLPEAVYHYFADIEKMPAPEALTLALRVKRYQSEGSRLSATGAESLNLGSALSQIPFDSGPVSEQDKGLLQRLLTGARRMLSSGAVFMILLGGQTAVLKGTLDGQLNVFSSLAAAESGNAIETIELPEMPALVSGARLTRTQTLSETISDETQELQGFERDLGVVLSGVRKLRAMLPVGVLTRKTVEYRLVTAEAFPTDRQNVLKQVTRTTAKITGGKTLIRFGTFKTEFEPLEGSDDKENYSIVYLGENSPELLALSEGYGLAATPRGISQDFQPSYAAQMVFSFFVQQFDAPIPLLQELWDNLNSNHTVPLDPVNYARLRRVEKGADVSVYENLTFRVAKIAWDQMISSTFKALRALGAAA